MSAPPLSSCVIFNKLLNTSSLSFLLCKIRIFIRPILQGCCEIKKKGIRTGPSTQLTIVIPTFSHDYATVYILKLNVIFTSNFIYCTVILVMPPFFGAYIFRTYILKSLQNQSVNHIKNSVSGYRFGTTGVLRKNATGSWVRGRFKREEIQ